MNNRESLNTFEQGRDRHLFGHRKILQNLAAPTISFSEVWNYVLPLIKPGDQSEEEPWKAAAPLYWDSWNMSPNRLHQLADSPVLFFLRTAFLLPSLPLPIPRYLSPAPHSLPRIPDA